MLELFVQELNGWDFLIAALIVLFVEYPIKTWILKGSAKYATVYKIAPIALGVIVYLIMSIVQGGLWTTGAVHGGIVGLAAMGSYDLILKTVKEKGISSAKEINEAVKDAIEDKD